jgi:hypothetical protein
LQVIIKGITFNQQGPNSFDVIAYKSKHARLSKTTIDVNIVAATAPGVSIISEFRGVQEGIASVFEPACCTLNGLTQDHYAILEMDQSVNAKGESTYDGYVQAQRQALEDSLHIRYGIVRTVANGDVQFTSNLSDPNMVYYDFANVGPATTLPGNAISLILNIKLPYHNYKMHNKQFRVWIFRKSDNSLQYWETPKGLIQAEVPPTPVQILSSSITQQLQHSRLWKLTF